MSSILFAPSGHMTEDEYVQHREREVKRTQRRANTRYRKKRHRFTFRVNAKQTNNNSDSPAQPSSCIHTQTFC